MFFLKLYDDNKFMQICTHIQEEAIKEQNKKIQEET